MLDDTEYAKEVECGNNSRVLIESDVPVFA
jgi:hypothetical protein